jgi:hypothetical protein
VRPARAIAATVAFATIALTALSASPAVAGDVVHSPCADVEVIFARGSGQGLEGKEYASFTKTIEDRLGSAVSQNNYELGSETIDGYNYRAVDVGNVWNGNAIGAKLSSGLANDYGASVWDGVKELISYIYPRSVTCPNTQFVLGGYSQGAQVIGQAQQYLSDDIRERIVFNALFGDPRLYLPEGEGWLGRAPACRGEELSTWRRTVPNCNVDNGSLGARKPYLPTTAWESITGLWCNDNDFVCGSSKWVWDTGGHMKYADVGGAIDEAAVEIASRVKTRLPGAAGIDTSPRIIRTGTTGLDVVFFIDSTGSMSGRIDAAKAYAATMAATIADMRGRVALIEYRDAGDEFVARTLTPLTTDVTAFRAQLDTISAGGGGDTPEALLAALMHGFNTLDWRAGATKAAVVLTDAGFHDPDVAAGWTSAQVAARALEIDPVNVYPVVPSSADPAAYKALADLTSGQVIDDSGDSAAALKEALMRISNRPVALLALDAYAAEPGQRFTFDASRSYGVGSDIASYAFDFDGDGSFDATGTSPIATHTYAAPFDGVMQVRVTAKDGGISSVSAPVVVAAASADPGLPAAPVGLAAVVTDTAADGTSTVQLTWSRTDNRATFWGVAVNGVPVGLADGASTTVQIGALNRSADVDLSVAGLTVDRAIGPSASVILPAVAPAGPTPGVTPTSGAGGSATPAASPTAPRVGTFASELVVSATASSPAQLAPEPTGVPSPAASSDPAQAAAVGGTTGTDASASTDAPPSPLGGFPLWIAGALAALLAGCGGVFWLARRQAR